MKDEKFTPGGKSAKQVLFVLLLLNVFNYMDRKAIAVAMEAIKLDLGFTDTQMGLLQGLFLLSIGFLILPAGILIDSWGRKKTVSLMAIIWSIATISTGLCSRFSTMLATRCLTGVGEAGFQPGGTSWISVVFPKKDRNKANGIFLMGPALGGIGGLMLSGWLITKTGDWRTPFFIFGILGVILGISALFLVDPVPPDKQKSSNLKKDIASLFQKKTFIGIAVAQGLYVLVLVTYQSWDVVLVMRGYNLNEVQAGVIMGLMFIPAILAPFIGGILADFLQKKTPIGRPLFAAIGCFCGSILFALQYYFTGTINYNMYLILMGVTAFVSTLPLATFQVINMDVFIAEKRAKAAAMVGLITFLFFSWWGSVLVGKISDMLGGGVYGVKMAMLGTTPFGIMACFACIWLFKSYARESAEADELEASLDPDTVDAIATV